LRVINFITINEIASHGNHCEEVIYEAGLKRTKVILGFTKNRGLATRFHDGLLDAEIMTSGCYHLHVPA
jgi:hypothetical protein